ncbi:TldD/PmbA family protein [Methanolapillus millepedarum]|uniref:Metalloprotease TldD n=1 Tax=Methanolapillus millepedarum TaxID=3028296 RepID=A0AA96V1Y7_9EURY|nr:Metalloprotease TldD [Methanosarcinaceae archaeon Ac7]
MDCILDAEKDEKQVFESVTDDIEKALQYAQSLGATDAEIIYSMKRATIINFKTDIIETARCSTNTGYGVRAIINGAVGFSGTNVKSSLLDSVKNAVESAKVMDPDPYFKSLPEKADYKPIDGLFDEKIIRMTLEECIDKTMDMISSAKEVAGVEPTSGSFSRSISHLLVMNTNGVFAKKKGTGISGYIDVVAESNLGSESLATAYDYEVSRSKDIDFAKIGQNAGTLAKKSVKGAHIPTSKLPVIFHSFAFSDILENTFTLSIDADNVQKERSGLVGKLNQKIGSEDLSIIDDGTLPGGIGSGPFDDEGTPTQRTDVIQNGYLKSYLYDSYTAGKDNVKSTGNGYRNSYSSVPAVDISNLIVQFPQSDIVNETKHALYVHTVIGAHTANEISGDFSVEGRNAFIIENGEITMPVKSVMISGNIYDMLSKIDGAGLYARKVGNIVTP